MIRATMEPEGGDFRVPFDATPWFDGASFSEITGLFHASSDDRDLGLSDEGDAVAIVLAKQVPELETLFRYLDLANKYGNCLGFAVRIDAQDAHNWLRVMRPGVFNHLMPEEA